MSEFPIRSGYLLETAKGVIELSKGMWLSLLRRRGLHGRQTQKRQRQCQQDQTLTTTKSQLLNIRKTISKVRTTRKAELPQRSYGIHRGRTVSLVKGHLRRRFDLFQDRRLFPQEIQKFQITQSFDNDCQSDDEEISKSLNNVLMSLCLAVYDNRLERS